MEWGCGEPEVCLGFRYYLENVEDVDFYKFGQDSTLEEYNNESNFNVVVYKVNLNSTSDSSGGSCSEGGSLFENFVNLQVLDGAKDVTEYFGTGKYARYDNKYYFYPVDTSVNRNYHISENRPPYSIFFRPKNCQTHTDYDPYVGAGRGNGYLSGHIARCANFSLRSCHCRRRKLIAPPLAYHHPDG